MSIGGVRHVHVVPSVYDMRMWNIRKAAWRPGGPGGRTCGGRTRRAAWLIRPGGDLGTILRGARPTQAFDCPELGCTDPLPISVRDGKGGRFSQHPGRTLPEQGFTDPSPAPFPAPIHTAPAPDTARGSARAARDRPPPIRPRARSARRADRRGDRRVHVGPDAGRDAAEDRRAERSALVDRDALERQLEHRGDDLQPQLAAGAAARDPAELGLARRARAIRSSESRRPNATPSSTARTSAPRSWRMLRPANAPRASGSACGVRSPAR